MKDSINTENPDFSKIKGSLARWKEAVILNISEISTIRIYENLSQPKPEQVVVTIKSGLSFVLTFEGYETLLNRIRDTRSTQGPNGLIEIFAKTQYGNTKNK